MATSCGCWLWHGAPIVRQTWCMGGCFGVIVCHMCYEAKEYELWGLT